jgi:hypothetical protein
MLIDQISNTSSSNAKLAITEFKKNFPLGSFLHFFVEAGGGASLNHDTNLVSQGEFRQLDTAYQGKKTASDSTTDFLLKIFGKQVRADGARSRRGVLSGGSDPVATALVRNLKSFSGNLGKEFMGYVINGNHSVDSKQFDGLRVLCAGLPATQTLTDFGENGLQVLDGISDTAVKSQQKFIKALRKLIRSVGGGASCIVMAEEAVSILTTIADQAVQITEDEFGRQITKFDRIPIVGGGYTPAGVENLPFSETLGTSVNCSSIFAFRSEEQAYLSMMTTPYGLYVGEPVANDVFSEILVELQCDSGCFNDRSIACLPGLRVG